ncbi:MAG: DNA alkylation repair protein [Agrococcus casei]|uniref:DNA alkylation repair protein n=1 Tax=Agrococcus casei TaxID=343512 RepID=UPI003F9A2BA2
MSEPQTDDRVASTLEELAQLEDPKARAINERHGNDYGVNLTKLRAVAKALKKDPELARQLWATDDTAARLVALLICKPKEFTADELDTMLREARTPKVHDWLIGYVVTKGPHMEALRERWMRDTDPVVASAGWALTAHRIAKGTDDGLDHDALLSTIESQMSTAHDRLQWEMNTTLAQIGIAHPQFRDRALAIGERLEVLKDYPTAPGCTSPFAPIWISEMVKRAEA